ncbi:MAG: PDZ domain-containing protein [Magnetococcus sp. WYHC-3]
MQGHRKTGLVLAGGVALLILGSAPALAGGWLGVTVGPPAGVRVGELFKDSPADRAGLHKGDVIVAVNDVPVVSSGHFRHLVRAAEAGSTVRLTLHRTGQELVLPVVLDDAADHESLAESTPAPGYFPPQGGMAPPPYTEGPEAAGGYGNFAPPPSFNNWAAEPGMGQRNPPSPPEARDQVFNRPNAGMGTPGNDTAAAAPAARVWLGVTVNPAPGGVLVSHVAEGSPAAAGGVAVGDVIAAVNNQGVASAEELAFQIHSLAPGDRVALSVNRDGTARSLSVQLEAPVPAQAPAPATTTP